MGGTSDLRGDRSKNLQTGFKAKALCGLFSPCFFCQLFILKILDKAKVFVIGYINYLGARKIFLRSFINYPL
jgi:hypothetical protein